MKQQSNSTTRSRILFHVGNICILFSLVFLSLLTFPLLKVYFFPTTILPVEAMQKQGFSISIPAISAQAPVIEAVDPWNEAEYKEKLKKGVAHAKGTSLPGSSGTIFLFAHSSGAPWEQTGFNTVFLRLGELQSGDSIVLTRNGEVYKYKVFAKKEVWPHEVAYLTQTKEDQLILQTCTPIGTSLKRLLIFAKPQSSE